MRILEVDLARPEKGVVEEAAQVVRRGGVVLTPTDTIYGFSCDPLRGDALQRVLKLKGRPQEKGFLVLLWEASWAVPLCGPLPPPFPSLSRRLWPGPVTFLLPARPELPPLLVGRGGKIGLRCPSTPFLREWLQATGGPLLSTSANRSGQPPPSRWEELLELFGGKVDLILKGPLTGSGLPSTVVDLTERPPRIVRAGEHLEEVRRALAQVGGEDLAS